MKEVWEVNNSRYEARIYTIVKDGTKNKRSRQKDIHTNQCQITGELTILVGILYIIQYPDTYNFLAPKVNYSSYRRM